MSTPPPIRSIPRAYEAGEQAEYSAIRGGCAIDRIVPRALLEVAGEGPVTALLRALRFRLFDPGPADVRAAVILDGERVTATATVVRRAPDRLLLDCSNPTSERVLEAAGVELLEHGDQLVRMRLRGPSLAAVLGTEPPAPGVLRTDVTPGGASTLLCGTGFDRVTIYCGRDSARACWDALVAAGALPVGSTALETVRIEDAEPCLERDFPQPVAPELAGVGEFAHGDDSRVLVAIEHEGPTPLAHATLRIDGAEVGDLRVGARSVQRAGRAIALATIDRALAAPGVPVNVDAGERVLAGVVTRRAGLP
ncbi:MAG: aminomethyltransferase [Gaiellaceae bacterium]|nr:aminomethyltransferase [Gaiellaceae bacterium]